MRDVFLPHLLPKDNKKLKKKRKTTTQGKRGNEKKRDESGRGHLVAGQQNSAGGETMRMRVRMGWS